MKNETQHTPGPVAWQKFGDQYYLTGQYGKRPIILGVGRRREDGENLGARPQFGLQLLKDGLLVDFTPDHPDAQFLVKAWNCHDDLLAGCKAALDCLAPTGKDTKSDRAITQLNEVIERAEGRSK